MFNKNLFYLTNSDLNKLTIVVPTNLNYYLNVHIRCSTFFKDSQYVDSLTYEVFSKKNELSSKKTNNFIYLNNFFLNKKEKSIYLATFGGSESIISKNIFSTKVKKLKSTENLFFNSSWLEREVSEMLGVFFYNKNDIRNLLLMYGDVFLPLSKFFPSIGLVDFTYSLTHEFVQKQKITL